MPSSKTTTKTPKRKYNNIYEAIAHFQYECPILHKNTKGYGYKYTDLAEIMRVITPLLEKHELMIMQPLSGTGMKTIIVHWASGMSIEEYVEIPQNIELSGMNIYQAFGAGITYWRRYCLCSYLGIISDKDIDMSSQKTEVKPSKPKLSDERFEEALEVIQKGEFTSDELIAKFDLTKKQLEKLK